MGLISDGDYAKSALNKLNLFEQSGLRLGEDLIISMESPKMPLKLKQVEEQMQRYLMWIVMENEWLCIETAAGDY